MSAPPCSAAATALSRRCGASSAKCSPPMTIAIASPATPASASRRWCIPAAHLMDLAALGLGARGDLALQAQRGGLRAVRLKSVLTILERRFAEPDFSAQKLAAAAGLSARYVNELLYEAGASFTMRLNEMRL